MELSYAYQTQGISVLQEQMPEQQAGEDALIAGLDPLGADGKLRQLPALNQQADVTALRALLYDLLPTPVQLVSFSYEQSAAAMRDIGFVLGSLKRHGIEPVQLVPELDYVLDVLGQQTNYPPRDTLLHYTSWNPEGLRMRTYTGSEDEYYLIKSVQEAAPGLLQAIFILNILHEVSPYSEAYGAYCQQAGRAFGSMTAGMARAIRHVKPAYFAKELRLYFDPITLHGQQWLGPGAVEMPMFVFDHLLWSAGSNDLTFERFQHTYLPYVLPYLRELYTSQKARPALVTKMQQALNEATGFDGLLWQNATNLLALCKQLKKFRLPHAKMADKSYKEQDGYQRSKGSGGYSTEVLQHIIMLYLTKVNTLSEALLHYENTFGAG